MSPDDASGSDLGLVGHVGAVTGGALGIGRACVLALAGVGSTVITLDRDQQAAHELVRLSATLPGTVHVVIGDATQTADLDRVVAVAADLGGLDFAVNVVGGPGGDQATALTGPILQTTPEVWTSVFAATALPTYLGCQVFGRAMVERGQPGAIVNIGASLGIRAAPYLAAFAAAKSGVHHFTQSLALELAPHRIRVNCIAPLFVDTPGSRAATSEGRRRLSAAAIPLGRVAQPEDIAGPVLFLVSPLSSFMTGQTLLVDGGLFCTTLRPPRGWIPPPGYLEQLSELAEAERPPE